LYSSFDGVSVRFIIFFIIGLSAIAASIKYTAGKNPYGYKGFGDIFVFIFFGPVAVCGVYFLITGNLDSPIWFAATGMGLLCTGVLNINNIRDLDNDKARGKITIPVLLGYKRAITYHVFLIVSGNLLLLIYALIFFNLNSCPSVNFKLIGLIFLLLVPLYFKGIFSVIKASERMDYNLQLKKLSLLNLMLSLVFGISQIISLC
ncbi:MAG: 1,4-dihydroxy-2-naphthoate octaprenyltransferase, partial [Bacteroidia bacterium]|nr:1,4-dihydroxy-2-naphthoate octaprenyltransferase [Bacteroidia bacterium]